MARKLSVEGSKDTRFKCKPVLKEAIKLAGTMPAADIAKKYGLVEKSFRSYACRQGVSLAFNYKPGPTRSWTIAEIRKLRSLASIKTAAQVGTLLNRSESSVKSKAYQLGIHFMKFGEHSPIAKYSNHDIELCRQLFDEGIIPSVIAEKMEVEYSHVCKIVKFQSRLYG